MKQKSYLRNIVKVYYDRWVMSDVYIRKTWNQKEEEDNL